jgi:hypothetical protein|tara:strand:- start:614 stop:979 length:366 start_codon:yes stop_codon:yes gene_type:complete
MIINKLIAVWLTTFPTVLLAGNEILTCHANQICNGANGCETSDTKLTIVVIDDLPKFVVKGSSLVEISINESAFSAYWKDEKIHNHLLFSSNSDGPSLISFDDGNEGGYPMVAQLECGDFK